jgi:hypothetical protein
MQELKSISNGSYTQRIGMSNCFCLCPFTRKLHEPCFQVNFFSVWDYSESLPTDNQYGFNRELKLPELAFQTCDTGRLKALTVGLPKFLSTMIVPPFPVEASGGPSYHALWPGLQPTDNSFVYQNVVDDWYPSQTNTRWDVSTWYGPSNTA